MRKCADRPVVFIVMAALVAAMVGAPAVASVQVGQGAPEISAESWFNGPADLSLAKLRGKIVVVEFWATWCPPCRKEIPHFIKLHEQTSRDTLVVVGISKEDPGTLKRFVQEHKVPYPIASAKGVSLPEPYSLIRHIPTTFFLDRNGIIQRVVVGYHDFDTLQSLALAEDFQGQPKSSPAAGRSPSTESSR